VKNIITLGLWRTLHFYFLRNECPFLDDTHLEQRWRW
jgi:hypothetical protein